MNILVTGATGFLGSHLLPELIKLNYTVIILKRSFSNIARIENIISEIKSYDIDKTKIEDVFQKNKIDVIIHLATDYGKKDDNNISQMVKSNIYFPAHLLSVGTRYGTSFFINTHTSTRSEYALYSATKNAFMEISKFFVANYRIRFINMVIEYMYGEKDDSTKFIPFAIEGILNNREIDATNGEQKRDLIYVKDVVNAYLKVLDKRQELKEKFIEFNIGTGKVISLRDCISKVEKLSGENANIKWGALPYKNNEVFYSQADISRAKELLGWEPEVLLEEGLSTTISWYKTLHKK